MSSNNNKVAAEATTTSSDSSNKAFPAKARVVLHGLKADEFNGKIGVIQQGAVNKEGRQQVYVEDLDKMVALKLTNMGYQERPVESLSNKELKTILRHREVLLKFQGMDKVDLQARLEELSSDPLEIAEWLAHANAPSSADDTTNNSIKKNNSNNDGDIQAGLEEFDQLSPTQLRQQAQMMRTMPPATIRSINPQLAHMTDAQIQQAAAQMEMMANNPQMMEQARQQMKNLSPSQKEQYKKMMQSSTSPSSATAASGNPQDMLGNMTPEQLQQQAQMMRTMPPSTIRAMNPQLANMTDEQIQQAASQMEMMASNPELMKMAAEQMKNLKPEEMEEMIKSQNNFCASAGGGSTSNSNTMNPMIGMASTSSSGANNTTMDPAKMLETMDTAQIKQMMQMLKSNPEMLQNLAAQTGMPKEGLEKTLSCFADMSDEQLESSLKTMAKIQRVTGAAQKVWKASNEMVGGHLKMILVVGVILFFLFVVLYWLGGSGPATRDVTGAAAKLIQQSDEMTTSSSPSISSAKESSEDEFSDEF